MTDDDIRYFERRRKECIDRAAAAQDPHLVAVHRAFAVHYMRVLQHHCVARDEDAAG